MFGMRRPDAAPQNELNNYWVEFDDSKFSSPDLSAPNAEKS